MPTKADSSLIRRLCESLAFHVVETEQSMSVTEWGEDGRTEMEDECVTARDLIAEAGYDIDDLYPPDDRPQLMSVGEFQARAN